MIWQEIYNKYKDSELMQEFRKFWYDKKRNCYYLHIQDIKDIIGYLICFAETKGYFFYITYDSDLKTFANIQVPNNKHESVLAEKRKFKNIEQAMLWCVDKFFEVAE